MNSFLLFNISNSLNFCKLLFNFEKVRATSQTSSLLLFNFKDCSAIDFASSNRLELINEIIDEKLSVAIIGIDPSSPFHGGSILGDRIRFVNDFKNKNIFFRSMSTRGSQGGLASSAKFVADIFDASGYDIIIFETVGVGQVEVDVIEAVDTVIVTLVPESGDDIQMMKGGLMEIADLYVINKSDRQGSDKLFALLNKAIELNEHRIWKSKIIKTVATSGEGITQLYSCIKEHKDLNDQLLDPKIINDIKIYSLFSVIIFIYMSIWTEYCSI